MAERVKTRINNKNYTVISKRYNNYLYDFKKIYINFIIKNILSTYYSHYKIKSHETKTENIVEEQGLSKYSF